MTLGEMETVRWLPLPFWVLLPCLDLFAAWKVFGWLRTKFDPSTNKEPGDSLGLVPLARPGRDLGRVR